MIVSLFGNIEFGDRAALINWLGAHDVEHRRIKQALTMVKGASIQSVMLGGDQIDNDWFGMHGLTHVAIARSMSGAVTSESASLLSTNVADWNTEAKFKTWHHIHDVLHGRINSVLGLTG